MSANSVEQERSPALAKRKVSSRYEKRDEAALAELATIAQTQDRNVRWRDCFRLAARGQFGDSSIDADAKRLWRKIQARGLAQGSAHRRASGIIS